MNGRTYSECQDCRRLIDDELVVPIPDLEQRVAPGEPMPSGECPHCGAVCHPTDERPEPTDAEIQAQQERVPFEQSEGYRDSMVDAGRGHLLR